MRKFKKGDNVFYVSNAGKGFPVRSRVETCHKDGSYTITALFRLDEAGDDQPAYLGDKFRIAGEDLTCISEFTRKEPEPAAKVARYKVGDDLVYHSNNGLGYPVRARVEAVYDDGTYGVRGQYQVTPGGEDTGEHLNTPLRMSGEHLVPLAEFVELNADEVADEPVDLKAVTEDTYRYLAGRVKSRVEIVRVANLVATLALTNSAKNRVERRRLRSAAVKDFADLLKKYMR